MDVKPIYNLKVVLRETGIKADTLRAWERRYDLPQPERTAGGHRLYSHRDVETIKWLLARQDEGLSISRAVQLWRELEARDRDPLEAYEPSSPPLEAYIPVEGDDADMAHIRHSWIQACLGFDEVAADQILVMALARYAPERVCLKVIKRGLSQIGRLWYENKATVQQEHVASQVALRRISALLTLAPPPGRDQLIHLYCPPHEEHTFPLMLLELLLRNRGWPVTYFGADVPLAQMERVLAAGRPALAVLASQTLWTASEALAMARFFAGHNVPIAYGGNIFNRLPPIRPHMPGHFLGETIEEGVAAVADILLSKRPMPTIAPVPENYGAILAAYEQRHWLIEGHVAQALQAEGWTEHYLSQVNRHLANNIRAALTFGDLNLIDCEIDWVRGLLAHNQIPRESLARYLAVYHRVAQEYLDESGAPLVEWLADAADTLRAALRQPLIWISPARSNDCRESGLSLYFAPRGEHRCHLSRITK